MTGAQKPGSIRSVAICVLVSSLALNAAERKPAESELRQIHPSLVVSTPREGMVVWRLGLRRGIIKQVGACIMIAASTNGGGTELRTIIFPAKYRYNLEQGPDGSWVINDSQGKKWAAVGDSVAIAGRVVKNETALEELLSIEDRRRCPGPYWELTPNEAL